MKTPKTKAEIPVVSVVLMASLVQQVPNPDNDDIKFNDGNYRFIKDVTVEGFELQLVGDRMIKVTSRKTGLSVTTLFSWVVSKG